MSSFHSTCSVLTRLLGSTRDGTKKLQVPTELHVPMELQVPVELFDLGFWVQEPLELS